MTEMNEDELTPKQRRIAAFISIFAAISSVLVHSFWLAVIALIAGVVWFSSEPINK